MTPPPFVTPFYQIGLWSNVTFWQIPPPPNWETSFLDGPTAQDVDGALCKSSLKDSEKIAVSQEQNLNWIDSSERAVFLYIPRIFMGVSRIIFAL